jgi:hypothetical protein
MRLVGRILCLENTTSKYREQLMPIINDMNQLHSLLIQANDDNRMLFSNLKTVAMFTNNIFDIITLLHQLINKNSFNPPCKHPIIRILNIQNFILYSNVTLKACQKTSKLPNLASIDPMQSLNLEAPPKSTSLLTVETPQILQKAIRSNLDIHPLSQSMASPDKIYLKNHTLSPAEGIQMVEELLQKADNIRNSLIFEQTNFIEEPVRKASEKRTSIIEKSIT